MSHYAWTEFFGSLDFTREARIDLKMLSLTASDVARLKLMAVTPRSECHHVDITEKDGLLVFSLGDIGFPVDELILQDESNNELLRINDIYSSDDTSYRTQFRSNSTRPQDPYLNYFIGRQLVQYFPGSPSYRIAGAVVAVYKAVELMVPQFLDEAEGFLQAAEKLVPETPVARSPRKNREHLQLSLWCAEWHLRLAKGDFEGFLKCLKKVRHHLETETLTSYFNPAFPANRSLVMLCLYYRASGNIGESKAVARLATRLFQRSVEDSDQTLAHFRELGGIHRAAVTCLELMKRQKNVTPETVEKIFRSAIRAGGPKYPDAFDAMLGTLLRGLSLNMNG